MPVEEEVVEGTVERSTNEKKVLVGSVVEDIANKKLEVDKFLFK